ISAAPRTLPTSRPTAPTRAPGSAIASPEFSSWRPTLGRGPDATVRVAHSYPVARSIRASGSPPMPAKRLLSDVVSLTPSNYEDFTRWPGLCYCSALLGLPASAPAPSTDQGLPVHVILRKLHGGGACHDAAHLAVVLPAPGI